MQPITLQKKDLFCGQIAFLQMLDESIITILMNEAEPKFKLN